VKTKAFYLFALIVLTSGYWLYAGLLLSARGPGWLGALATAAWLLVSALALAAMRVKHSAWVYAGLLVLAVSSMLPPALVRVLPALLSFGFGTTLLMPSITAVPITLVLYSGLASRTWRHVGTAEGGDLSAERKQAEQAVVVLVLSALTLVCWEFAVLVFGPMFSVLLNWLTVLAVVLLSVSALVLAARKVSHIGWVLAALLSLASLFLPASMFLEPFSSEHAITLLLILSTALVAVALLLKSGLSLLGAWRNTRTLEGGGPQSRRKHVGKTALLVLVLGSFLLAKALHNLYWFIVWDNTGDSLGYFWLTFPVSAVLLSGVVLSIVLPGRTKLAGPLYSLLVPALLIGVTACALRVDFHQLTEERAERISQALETYYTREGHYPQDLRQLVPRYLLSLPGPVVIYGQDWCYDGGGDYYRLGYVDREHWSAPDRYGQIYYTKGEAPDLPGICAEELAALEERDAASKERR
jgi:hypothetical protein